MTADEIVAELGLSPHPEGGHYRQTFATEGAGRALSTCIYFLIRAGERSHWHRVDADEIWHFYRGAPLTLRTTPTDSGPLGVHLLGPELGPDRGPQAIVPAGHWQSAESTGDYTLVGCTVSPGFDFAGFDLAPPGFDIS